MKINRIELFILNYYYAKPEIPRSYSEVVVECRKEFLNKAESIRKHFDALVDKRFLKKIKRNVYCLPNRKIKKYKQYDSEAFILRIIDSYDLRKGFSDHYREKRIMHLLKRVEKVILKEWNNASTLRFNGPKKDFDNFVIKVVLHSLRTRYIPEYIVLNDVIQKLKKKEPIDINSIKKEVKELEKEQLEEVDKALSLINGILQTEQTKPRLLNFFKTLKPIIELERKDKKGHPLDWIGQVR
jgi:hypothetical protein